MRRSRIKLLPAPRGPKTNANLAPRVVQAADATSARELLTQLRREGLIAYISDDAPTKIVVAG
jgi:hypothetical protein